MKVHKGAILRTYSHRVGEKITSYLGFLSKKNPPTSGQTGF